MPIQAAAAVGVPGRIELDPDLVEGLADLARSRHLTLLDQGELGDQPTAASVSVVETARAACAATEITTVPRACPAAT
jgi:hypothetical protein